MNQKKKKQAVITMLCGFVFVVIGMIISYSGLFNAYGLASNSSICSGAACTTKINHDSLIVHIGTGAVFVGYGLLLIGVIALVYLSFKKRS